MRSEARDPELDSLLAQFDAAGGVLDYAFVEVREDGSPHAQHRAAAIAGMAEIDRRLERWAVQNTSEKYPIEMFYRVRWDEARLTGEPVRFSTFWGTDDVKPKPVEDCAQAIPNVDGYKTAFFHPPYGLRGSPNGKAALSPGSTSTSSGHAPSGPRYSLGRQSGQTTSRQATNGGAPSTGRSARWDRK
jgi:hypothetical protein